MVDKNSPWYVPEDRPWFKKESGWPDEVPKNIDFPKKSLGDMLKESVQKYPDHKAIWFLGEFMTYRQLLDYVLSLATALNKLGLKKGDVVAFLLPNSFQYVICYYACQMLGITSTGVNPTYKPAEVQHQLNATGAKALVSLDALYKPTVEPIISNTKIQTVIITNIADHLPWLKRTLGKALKKIPVAEAPKDALIYRNLLETPANVPEVKINPEQDIATFIMTGGTTGVPKAAMLTHFNLVSNVLQSAAWLYKIKAGSCTVGVLPLFHSFAMTCVMNISLNVGAWMMLFPRPPETEELVRTIAEIAPDGSTLYPGAEILFKRLAEFPDLEKYKVSGKFSLCVSGAGPLHRPVQEAFERRTGGRLTEGYGLTESSPVVSAGPFWGKRKIGSIGLPFPGTDWKILESDGTRELKFGEMGEICVHGPQVMKGYLNQPEETAEVLADIDGKIWLRTGDIGYMDEDGWIFIRDRKKQLIKYKGYSIFPKEIEELVGQHPAVSEVAAAGIPDPETGEVIKVWVVLRPEYQNKITEQELINWAKENMTHYKVPRMVEFRKDLPKSMVGKVMRRELQEADPLYQERKKTTKK